jgi:hypothetical protein
MYIQSYQIHNVLNVYRKQLSQMPEAKAPKQASTAQNSDRVVISKNGQRQSIIDQISAEIVDRIAQTGPQTRFEEVLGRQMEPADERTNGRTYKKDAAFTYTTIDENDNKVTNTLPVKNLSPIAGTVLTNAQKFAD